MRRYLIVANETATSAPLLDKIRQCMAEGPCQFHLVVPARHPHGAWSEGQVTAAARTQLEAAMGAFEALGAEATAEVGDGNPVLAVTDVLLNRAFDEIILSTHAPGVSRWLRQDVPTRLARRVSVPVTHVVAQPAHA